MPRHLICVLVIAAVLMLVGTAGCIAQPTVMVDSVRIGSLTPANTTLQVLIRIANPNSFDIPIQNVSFTVYSVEAGGTRRLGEGATGPFTLPGQQTIDQMVPVTLDNQALLQAALVAVRAGQDRMTFRVTGTVSGSVYGLVTVNVPFEQDQTLTLQEILGVAGVPVSEQQVQQVLGATRMVAGMIPAVTFRIGGG
jgi:LEA14-like dessication related protein